MQGAARGAAPRGDAAAAAGSKFPAGLGRVRLGLGRWGVVGSFLPLLAPSRSSRSRPSPMAASAQGEEEAVRGRFPAAAEGRCVGASGAGGEGLGKGGEKRLFLRAPGCGVHAGSAGSADAGVPAGTAGSREPDVPPECPCDTAPCDRGDTRPRACDRSDTGPLATPPLLLLPAPAPPPMFCCWEGKIK